jgi:hypothetical protein
VKINHRPIFIDKTEVYILEAILQSLVLIACRGCSMYSSNILTSYRPRTMTKMKEMIVVFLLMLAGDEEFYSRGTRHISRFLHILLNTIICFVACDRHITYNSSKTEEWSHDIKFTFNPHRHVFACSDLQDLLEPNVMSKPQNSDSGVG